MTRSRPRISMVTRDELFIRTAHPYHRDISDVQCCRAKSSINIPLLVGGALTIPLIICVGNGPLSITFFLRSEEMESLQEVSSCSFIANCLSRLLGRGKPQPMRH